MTRALALLVAVLTATSAAAHISVYGTGGRSNETTHGRASVQMLNVEIGRALSPRTEVAFVFAPVNFDQPISWFGDSFGQGNEDVRALSGAVLIRRRFNVDSSRVVWFGEAATGPAWAEKAVPASTSRFNFITQFGAGVELLPQARFPLLLGYRYLHVSNGGYSPRNPGLNFSGVTLGVRVRSARPRPR